jgi:DNA helicase HerA-like ATPase
LLVLEQQGAGKFFGEPALDIADFMRHAPDGRGIVNILAADKLMATPRLYSTFWEQKAIRAAAQTMRANPEINAERALRELQVGEALVSFLKAKGEPCSAS